MRSNKVAILLVPLCLLACGTEEDSANPAATGTTLSAKLSKSSLPDAAEVARMEQYLASRYLPVDVVHTFVRSRGETIDCVLRERQPALRVPAMAGHRIQDPPAQLPRGERSTVSRPGQRPVDPFFDSGLDSHGNVRTCPQGSVAIPRLTLNDLKRFPSLEDFYRKTPVGTRSGLPSASKTSLEPPTAPSGSHWYAYGQHDVQNIGGGGVFNIWSPAVARNSEFSLQQIWLHRGSGSDLQTVESGFQRYHDLYGDDDVHFFIYYTPDHYSTGCYNLSCTAFVVYDPSACVGCGVYPMSSDGGAQYEGETLWYRDSSGNWWLRWFTTWWGYYPASLFDSAGMGPRADAILFGGEVVDNVTPTYTATDMGSGAFPASGYSHAAYQRALAYVDPGNYYMQTVLSYNSSNSGCWDIAATSDFSPDTSFYFGGAGYNGGTCNND